MFFPKRFSPSLRALRALSHSSGSAAAPPSASLSASPKMDTVPSQGAEASSSLVGGASSLKPSSSRASLLEAACDAETLPGAGAVSSASRALFALVNLARRFAYAAVDAYTGRGIRGWTRDDSQKLTLASLVPFSNFQPIFRIFASGLGPDSAAILASSAALAAAAASAAASPGLSFFFFFGALASSFPALPAIAPAPPATKASKSRRFSVTE
mmetsp:Transcript_34280/g.77475  ORF Transcript_34280/g.77475 Transcript_34280/m.77475 type:complete len:213 (+) Transcript_34280:1448-2086(+)